MEPTTRRLLLASVLLLAVAITGTVISIVYKLPYEFSGQGDPDNVLRDFVAGGGTALSPPLPPMILALVFTILAPSRRWWGTVGVVGLCIFGSQYIIGESQEPIVWRSLRSSDFGPLDAVVALLGVLGILLGALVLLLGVMELVDRMRARRQPSRVR